MATNGLGEDIGQEAIELVLKRGYGQVSCGLASQLCGEAARRLRVVEATQEIREAPAGAGRLNPRLELAFALASPRIRQAMTLVLHGNSLKEAATAVRMDASQLTAELRHIGCKISGLHTRKRRKKADLPLFEGVRG